MARLVDADSVSVRIKALYNDLVDFKQHCSDEKINEMVSSNCNGILECLCVVQTEPTIEAEPVKQEWISVKDRLPEQYSYVIAFTGLEVMEAFYDGWRFGCTSKSHPISVTHWMPLPEPPKEG